MQHPMLTLIPFADDYGISLTYEDGTVTVDAHIHSATPHPGDLRSPRDRLFMEIIQALEHAGGQPQDRDPDSRDHDAWIIFDMRGTKPAQIRHVILTDGMFALRRWREMTRAGGAA